MKGRKIKVRLIRTRGTTRLKSQILITTLLDEEQYKWEELSKLYLQRYKVELAFRHLKTKIGIERGMESKLNLCIKALKSCYSICRPWRVFPRICQFPSSVFTRQKTSQKNSELKKVEFLAKEYKKLGVKYGML